MTIPIPDVLTSENSEKYILSIRLRSGGLSFSTHLPAGGGESFCYREVLFERDNSYINSLKEFFFANEWLTWHYKRVQVVWVSGQYTVVPFQLFREEEADALLAFGFSEPEKRSMCNPLKLDHEAMLLFGLTDEVYEFCSRSLLNPRFYHHLTPSLMRWCKQSRTSLTKQMYVVLHSDMVDIACFAQGKLLFANSFLMASTEEVLYHLLNVWREVGLSQTHDSLSIWANSQQREAIIPPLRTYLQHIHPMEIPSEAYLLGSEVNRAPVDLILLSLCEL